MTEKSKELSKVLPTMTTTTQKRYFYRVAGVGRIGTADELNNAIYFEQDFKYGDLKTAAKDAHDSYTRLEQKLVKEDDYPCIMLTIVELDCNTGREEEFNVSEKGAEHLDWDLQEVVAVFEELAAFKYYRDQHR